MSHLPIEELLLIATASGVAISTTTQQLFKRLFPNKINKLTPEGYDALAPKPLTRLPESKRFQRGGGYRDQGYEPMRCHRCNRPCIYCAKVERQKKRRR